MIQLRIHDESELYNSFDPSCTRISDEVYEYLKSFCTEFEPKAHSHGPETIQVISDGPVDAERLKSAIRNAVKKDQAEFDRQLAFNHKQAMGGYLFGIGLSALGIGLSILLDQVLLAIISFMGTQTFTDAFTIHTRLNPEIRRLKKMLDPFAKAELEIVQK